MHITAIHASIIEYYGSCWTDAGSIDHNISGLTTQAGGIRTGFAIVKEEKAGLAKIM